MLPPNVDAAATSSPRTSTAAIATESPRTNAGPTTTESPRTTTVPAGAGSGLRSRRASRQSLRPSQTAGNNDFTLTVFPEELLWNKYEKLYAHDPDFREEALRAAEEMRNTPLDDLDMKAFQPKNRRIGQDVGVVSRRAPPNPFHSPLFTKNKTKIGVRTNKMADPALQHNPLRGRLLVTIGINFALFMVFCQALLLNKKTYSKFHTTFSENSMLGPSPYVLSDLGALNVNSIRNSGEGVRIFWSMWMHGGWLHIIPNVICQLQFFHMLEPDWGAFRTLVLFIVAGISGNLLSCAVDPCRVAVGSSGGLFGLMGAMVPYVIEYWYSIPRPLCILIFSVVTVIISFATSLSSTVATWAHIGGLIGGILCGFMTITTPAAFLPKEKALKKQLRRNAVLRWLQEKINPDCKCGILEWVIRFLSLAALVTMWVVCFIFIFYKYEYQGIGSITYKGITRCCCCHQFDSPSETPSIQTWTCNPCEALVTPTETFEDQCRMTEQQTKKARRGLLLLDYKEATGVSPWNLYDGNPKEAYGHNLTSPIQPF